MQNLRKRSLLFALPLLGILLFFAFNKDAPACDKGLVCIDEVLTAAEQKGFAGTVLVADGDKILFQKGYGMTAPEGGVPIDENTVYLIGSIVKPFTRMAIAALEDRGLLSTSDSLSKFFPNVPKDKKDITLQQLLDHKAGIPDLIGEGGKVIKEYWVGYDYLPVTRDQMVEKTLKARLLYAPGTDEVYSNSGFALLAAIIEIVSGEPYEDFVYQAVFEPAGMKYTGYRRPDWSNTALAHGIDHGKDWGTALDDDRWMADGPSWNLRGNGGMLGTVPDLYLWLRALAKDGVYPEHVRQTLIGDLKFSQNYQSHYFAAAGSNGIYNSIFFFMLDQNRMIIMITSNSEHNAEEDYIQDFLPYAFVKYQNN